MVIPILDQYFCSAGLLFYKSGQYYSNSNLIVRRVSNIVLTLAKGIQHIEALNQWGISAPNRSSLEDMSASLQTVLKIPPELKLTRVLLAKLFAENFPSSGTNVQIKVDRVGCNSGVITFLMYVIACHGINMIMPFMCLTAEMPHLPWTKILIELPVC